MSVLTLLCTDHYNNKDSELIYKVNNMIYKETQCYFLNDPTWF